MDTESLHLAYNADFEISADEMRRGTLSAMNALVRMPPARAATEVFAIVGRRGSGKSYAAGKLVEELLTRGRQVIVVDVVGTWWGLRLGADGDPAGGHDIPVIGGDHGDIDLVAEGGAVVAQMVVDTGSSVVLDLSNLRKGPRQKFLTDFAEELFHLKKSSRSPVHVVLEEAHTIIPQRIIKGQERMLGAFEDLVRLGRNYGIGITMIDQRPQSVHKDALNQAEVLLAFQLTGKHERDAVRGWAEAKELPGIKDAFSALSSLPRGQCIAWSPQWLTFCGKVDIGPKDTFDASATPDGDVDDKTAKKMRPIDLDALRVAMAEAAGAKKKPADKRPPPTGRFAEPAPEPAPEPADKQVDVLAKEVAALCDTEKALRAELDYKNNDLRIVRDRWGRALTELHKIKSAVDELAQMFQIGDLQVLGSTEFASNGVRAVHRDGAPIMDVSSNMNPARYMGTQVIPIPVKQPERGHEPKAEYTYTAVAPRHTELATFLGGEADPSLSVMQRSFLTVLYQRGACTQAQILMFANYGKNGHTTKAFRELKEKGFVVDGNFGAGAQLALNGNGARALAMLEPLDKPKISEMERAFLVALAQRGKLTQKQVHTQTLYGKNGHTAAALKRLRAIGAIEGDDDGVEITAWGREVLGSYTKIAVGRDFHRALISGAIGKLSQMERQFLAVIWVRGGRDGVDGVTQADVLKDTQYGKNGHTAAAFKKLVTMGLCRYTDNGIACSADLFD